MKRIYLDANGSCPPGLGSQEKIAQLLPLAGNPSSFHEQGRALRAIIDDARDFVAKSLNARPRELIFTSGASEANRLFVDALILKAQREQKTLKVAITPFEHPSLLKPILAAADEAFFEVAIFELNSSGQLIFNEDLALCDVLICCQAHNESGVMPNIDDLLKHISSKTLVMSDVSQGLARLEPLSSRVDVMTCSAQKMGGYAGSGALVMRGQAANLPAPWPGGGQERGFRPGTESALLIAAFGEAARVIDETRRLNQELAPLRNHFEHLLNSLACRIIGNELPRLPNTSAVSFQGQNPDALRIACDLAGLSVGFGAACSGLAPEGSFALKRMGLNLEEEKTTVRFSLAPGTTFEDIEETYRRLVSLVLRPHLDRFP
jgi:cysteine desulfurase